MDHDISAARYDAKLAKSNFEKAQNLLKFAQDQYRYAEMALDPRNASIIANRIALDAAHKRADKLFEKHASLPYCASVRFEIAD